MKGSIPGFMVACLLAAPLAQASFMGSTLLGEYSNNLSEPAWCSETSVVGAGVEFECPGGFQVDVSSDQVLYTLSGFGTFGGGDFNGFVLSDASATVPGIVAVTIASTTLAGMDPSRLWFDTDSIWLNLSGLEMPDLKMSTLLDVTFAAVTEPGSFALLSLGIAGLGLCRRRTASETERESAGQPCNLK